jgi:hypothetical protein
VRIRTLLGLLAGAAAWLGCESMGPIATQMANQYVASLKVPPAAPPPPEYAAGYGAPPTSYTTTPAPSPEAPPAPPPPPPPSPPPAPEATAPPAPPPATVQPLPALARPELLKAAVIQKPVFMSTIAKPYAVQLRGEEQTRFDCSAVNDEFDQLMFGDVLVNPGAYVETIGGRISRAQFDADQKGRLRLRADRAASGVGLLRTSTGARAKFVYAFADAGGAIDLIDATVYAGDATGTSKRHGAIRLAPGSAVDLDFPVEGAEPEAKETALDLGYRLDADGQPVLESLGAAAVEFPKQSLCGEVAPAGESTAGG